MTVEQEQEYRKWLDDREKLCLSQAQMIENNALKYSETKEAYNVLLWRARATVYHECLTKLGEEKS